MKKLSSSLSEKESKRYSACKQQIAEGMQTVFDTGLALKEIRDGKLYREEFETFQDFCQTAYQIGRAHAYRLIESAEVKISPIGDKINNEAQARAIAKVPEANQKNVLNIANQFGEITAENIRKALQISKNLSPIGDKITAKEIRHDAIGRILPEEVIEDWDRAEQTASRLRSCASEIKVTVERGLADKDIIFAEITNPTISEAAGLHYTLSQIAPHAVCPNCQGRNRKNCQLCKRRGWISKFLFNSPAVSKETKAILEKAAATRK